MNAIRCSVCNKYYDAEKYETCPHCESSKQEPQPMPPVLPPQPPEEPPHGGRRSLRGLFRKKKEEKPPQIADPDDDATTSGLLADKILLPVMDDDDDSTIPVNRSDLADMPTTFPIPPQTPAPKKKAPARAADPIQPDPPVQQSKPAGKADEDKTVAFYRSLTDVSQPVVGWLVCVKGAYKGRSFELNPGRNLISRSENTHISLPNEASIEAEKHACVTYEPMKKHFYLQSLEKSARTCVGGVQVTTPVELKSFDEITLGDAEFVFVRLCGSRFNWEKFTD